MNNDYTPVDFNPCQYRNGLTAKRKILDRYVYPLSTQFETAFRKWQSPNDYDFSFLIDRILFGERGSGFIALSEKLKTFIDLSEANVLIQGCGLGQEALAWSDVGVRACTGVDLFDFTQGWHQIVELSKPTDVNFLAGDLSNTSFADRSFDLISSFAVWEHIRDFPAFIKETKRLIKPQGVVMAAFGPLWYTYGGDHFSDAGGLECGFNHVLLDRDEYLRWIDSFQPQNAWATSSENYFEIRKHINEGLFSYLRPREYIESVEQEFIRLHTIAVVSPESLKFRQEYPDKWQKLLDRESMLEEDLLIKSLIFFLIAKE